MAKMKPSVTDFQYYKSVVLISGHNLWMKQEKYLWEFKNTTL